MEQGSTVRFTIMGEPVGKGRPKFDTRGPYVRAVTPKKTANYETLVRMEYHSQCGDFYFPDKTPIFVLIDCYMAAPQSVSKKRLHEMLSHVLRPTKKVDWDNAGKIICDSLNGIAYHDDSQIVDGHVRKFYASKPKVDVYLSDHEINFKNAYPMQEEPV